MKILKSIQENISDLEDAKEAVLSHCMCLKFEETPQHYIVIFPEGGEIGREAHGIHIHGCRISKGMGKIEALKVLADKLEYYWVSSQVGYISRK